MIENVSLTIPIWRINGSNLESMLVKKTIELSIKELETLLKKALDIPEATVSFNVGQDYDTFDRPMGTSLRSITISYTEPLS